MKVPIFKLKFDLVSKLKLLRGVWDIFSSDRPIGESKYVSEFENKFKKLINANYAVSCSNGTTALELALKTIDVKNKVVLMPSNTFFATSIAVTNSGGIIELLDIEESTFSICPKDLENKINNNVGAVIIVHIGGIISNNIEQIVKLCKNHNVPLIEDAAHAHCSVYEKYQAGTIGDMACFSFFPTKVMTTGEGGMITTNSESHYKKIKSLKNFGRDINNIDVVINEYGNNFKVSELIGLLGSIECDRVMNRIARRNVLLKRYEFNLIGTDYKIIKQGGLGLCSYYKIILITPINNTYLKEYCKKHGVSLTGEVYRIPVHKQPIYLKLFSNMNLPITEKLCSHHICPPLYPELTFEEVDYVCDILKKAILDYEK